MDSCLFPKNYDFPRHFLQNFAIFAFNSPKKHSPTLSREAPRGLRSNSQVSPSSKSEKRVREKFIPAEDSGGLGKESVHEPEKEQAYGDGNQLETDSLDEFV
mgnify:CR=1 FL=1